MSQLRATKLLAGRIAAWSGVFVLAVGLYSGISRLSVRAQSQQDTALTSQLQSVLANNIQANTNMRTIDSSLGFKVTYNKAMLQAEAQTTDATPQDSRFTVTGTTYTDDELQERRDYSLVKFIPFQDESREIGSFPPELVVLTNIRESYWDSRVAQAEYKGLSKLDIWVSEVSKTKLADGYVVTSTTDKTINNIPYKEVRFDYSVKTDVPFTTSDVYYFTVQNDRPYYASLNNYKTDDPLIAEYQSIIKSISYDGLDTEKLALQNQTFGSGVLAADEGLPESTSSVPEELSADGLLDIVAKNQIAVVRVGTLMCMDLEFVLPSGATVGGLTQVCAAGIGSGSIVTSDGYVATNGHVVRMTKFDVLRSYILMSTSADDLATRIGPLMEYFISRGDLSAATSDRFLDAVRSRDDFAIQRALSLHELFDDEELRASNESPSFAIQLSDQPLKIYETTTPMKFVMSDSIISATLIGDNFEGVDESGRVDFQTLTGTDVAMLKMEGTFPFVDLGTILNIQTSDRLTAIGFPGFIDDGLETKSERTVPSVTQGYVESIESQTADSQYKLIITTVPIAQGNSGGPSFNDSGVQIGLNTYSILPCRDGKCFGNGIIRDVEDFKQLAAVKGVQFTNAGGITRTWRQGVDEFKAGNYVQAAKEFNKVANDYKGHYLAVAMRGLAETKAGVPIDYEAVSVGLVAGVGVGFMLLIAIIVIVALVIRRQHKHALVAAYGVGSQPVAQPVAPSPFVPQTTQIDAVNPQDLAKSPQVQPSATPLQNVQPTATTSESVQTSDVPVVLVQPAVLSPNQSQPDSQSQLPKKIEIQSSDNSQDTPNT